MLLDLTHHYHTRREFLNKFFHSESKFGFITYFKLRTKLSSFSTSHFLLLYLLELLEKISSVKPARAAREEGGE